MNIRQVLPAIFLALVATWPAQATDSHTYGKDEYTIISTGLAPNKQMSLAAHGDGEGAVENFQLWLMAEPAKPSCGRMIWPVASYRKRIGSPALRHFKAAWA